MKKKTLALVLSLILIVGGDIVLGLHGIEVGGKPCVSGRGKAGGGTFLP